MIVTHHKKTLESILVGLHYEDFLPLNFLPLAGDGSPRQFFRLFSSSSKTLVLVLPAKTEEAELAESRAAYFIGRHLYLCGVPVPEPFFWDEDSGILLFEDLGDMRLQDCAALGNLRELYRDTVVQLARMQCRAAENFDEKWCWDTPRYDRKLMLERESGYFLDAFWQGLLQQQIPQAIYEDFTLLADRAAQAPDHYFLHRDFQSRNIMIKNGRVRIIDFQGGRFGPLAYDLASLLNDPYVNLPYELRSELADIYFSELRGHIHLDRKDFDQQFTLLACQRNLQILGAFSFLSEVRRKRFFADFIKPSLKDLQQLLESEYLSDLRVLKGIIQKAARLLE